MPIFLHYLQDFKNRYKITRRHWLFRSSSYAILLELYWNVHMKVLRNTFIWSKLFCIQASPWAVLKSGLESRWWWPREVCSCSAGVTIVKRFSAFALYQNVFQLLISLLESKLFPTGLAFAERSKRKYWTATLVTYEEQPTKEKKNSKTIKNTPSQHSAVIC